MYSNYRGFLCEIALFSIKLIRKGIGEIAYGTLNKTKWAAMCKIIGEEMLWIRMEPSYKELEYSLKIDGYWKFQRYQYAVQVMG